jgi:hypothetical protein
LSMWSTPGARSKKQASPRRGGRGLVPRVVSGTPWRGAVPGGRPSGGVASLHPRLLSEMPSASASAWRGRCKTALLLRWNNPVAVKSRCSARKIRGSTDSIPADLPSQRSAMRRAVAFVLLGKVAGTPQFLSERQAGGDAGNVPGGNKGCSRWSSAATPPERGPQNRPPRRGVAEDWFPGWSLAPPAGCAHGGAGSRGCRFAPPPATFWDAFGIGSSPARGFLALF